MLLFVSHCFPVLFLKRGSFAVIQVNREFSTRKQSGRSLWRWHQTDIDSVQVYTLFLSSLKCCCQQPVATVLATKGEFFNKRCTHRFRSLQLTRPPVQQCMCVLFAFGGLGWPWPLPVQNRSRPSCKLFNWRHKDTNNTFKRNTLQCNSNAAKVQLGVIFP